MDAFGQHGTPYGHLRAKQDAERIARRLRAETGLRGPFSVEHYERSYAGSPVWCVRAGNPHLAAIVAALIPDRRALTATGRTRRLVWVCDAPISTGPIARMD